MSSAVERDPVTTSMPVTSRRPSRDLLLLTTVGAVGLIVSLADTASAFNALSAARDVPSLTGADNELGYPASALSMTFFVVAVSAGAAGLGGVMPSQALRSGLATLSAVGVTFQLWVTALSPGWAHAAEVLLMTGLVAVVMPKLRRDGRPLELGIFLAVASVVGFFAAFRLTVEKVGTFIAPDTAPTCNVSPLVQCGKNLASWQGSLFGFPNPIVGIGGWVALFVMAVLIIVGASFARWMWIAINVGVALALGFVVFLIVVSVFVLGTLCPWCMATWAAVIPCFWLITLYNLKDGNIRTTPRLQRLAAEAYGFVPLITLISYLVVAGLAQVQLDVIHRL